jgi:hypothetical protein
VTVANKGEAVENDQVTISRSLAERTEALFRSVDPNSYISMEWTEALKINEVPFSCDEKLGYRCGSQCSVCKLGELRAKAKR